MLPPWAVVHHQSEQVRMHAYTRCILFSTLTSRCRKHSLLEETSCVQTPGQRRKAVLWEAGNRQDLRFYMQCCKPQSLAGRYLTLLTLVCCTVQNSSGHRHATKSFSIWIEHRLDEHDEHDSGTRSGLEQSLHWRGWRSSSPDDVLLLPSSHASSFLSVRR